MQYNGEAIISLTEIAEGVSVLQYDINTDQSITEAYTFTPLPNDTSWNITYTVEYLGDKIIVSPIDDPSGTTIEINASDGYINEFISYNGPTPDNGTRTVFTRNAMDQIETISNFAIDTQSGGVEVPTWNLSFETYLDYNYPSISNPVYAVGVNSLYNIHIIELLDLKISSTSPSNSTITALEETVVVDKIETEVVSVTENGMLKQLDYTQEVFGTDDVRTIQFNY